MAELKASTQLAGVTNLSLLATVKDGFVDHSFQRITHAKRLEAVLGALNALRLGQREVLREPWALPDLIGRLDNIHEFRFTLLPPAPGAADQRSRFLLSVTFDGGWEPYMRLIWRDLGTLLDLMFCHCEGYPLAHRRSYAEYIAWVRANEVGGDYRAFYFVDAPVTVGDQRALPSGRPPLKPDPSVADRARAALKPIVTLYGLAPFFTDDDGGILLRAAHDIVVGIRKEGITQLAFPQGSPQREPYRAQLDWFEAAPMPRVQPPSRGGLRRPELQGGILTGYAGLTDGVLLLLRVADRDKAVAALRALEVTAEAGEHLASPYCNVAFTHAGLAALGQPAEDLALFPQEFVQGMEARCGILGDVRGNHPNAWLRPKRHDANGRAPLRIELSLVHVMVQWRAGFEQRGPADFHEDGVHRGFDDVIDALRASGGLELLAREAMVRLGPPPSAAAAPPSEAPPAQFDHLGFSDGLSQPTIDPPARPIERWNDRVAEGEFFLGHPNSRGDGPYPAEPNLLLDHGSFLVVRKLRQHVDTMIGVVNALEDTHGVARGQFIEAMLGRRRDGTPLVSDPGGGGPNDFNFHADPTGAVCPLRSHVRRANPRNGDQAVPKPDAPPVPRLLRRGMGYGTRADLNHPDDSDRGIFFMAYVGSIAEQFEVIQRWLSGGNSTSGLSTDADPLLGVPQPDGHRGFPCPLGSGEVRLDLGAKPFVSLQWGLYLFAPSLPALRRIGRLVAETRPALPPMPAASTPPTSKAYWQGRLEALEPEERSAAWGEVRRQAQGVLATDYGVLAGSAKAVREIFANAGGDYSVAGYGERMKRSVGLNHLGMDPPQHGAAAEAVNQAIETIDETKAFDATLPKARGLLAAWPTDTDPNTGLRTATIDLSAYIDRVLAMLCTQWFGLPEAAGTVDPAKVIAGSWRPSVDSPPRCPGDVLSASRYVFQPDPSPEVQHYGQQHGQGLKAAALAHMQMNGGHFPAAFAHEIEQAVRRHADASIDEAALADEIARTVIGVMFGFTPTVFGNARTVFAAWLRGPLWPIQLALTKAELAALTDEQRADAVVRPKLEETMVRAPVPDMLWRRATCPHSLQGVRVEKHQTVVVGVLSASQAEVQAGQPDPYLMFGGQRGSGTALHACPGYGMAMGVLKAMAMALLEAGTIRRLTPSPSALSIAITLER